MTYEYECAACGHQWEAEQSIKDNPLKKCVSCGKNKAKRLVSGGTGFLLKGGGWYADGYGSGGAGSGGAKAAATSESKPSAASKSSDTAKTSDKPATSSTTETSPSKGSSSTGSAKAS
jgi:putative FmdB family regulatory protein